MAGGLSAAFPTPNSPEQKNKKQQGRKRQQNLASDLQCTFLATDSCIPSDCKLRVYAGSLGFSFDSIVQIYLKLYSVRQ